MRKKIIFRSIIGVIFLALAGGAIWAFANYSSTFVVKKANLKASQVPKWKASTEALTSKATFRKTISHYFPEAKSSEITNENSPVIPGLLGAWSINPKTGKASYATEWTPQGITAIDDKYILVSAYDGNHKLDSLLYVIDFKTGKYLKTVILPNQSHVGGIDYDSKHQRIWISTDPKGAAALSVLSLSALENYDASKSKMPVKIDDIFKLPWLKATSTIAYSELDNAIIVPYFAKETSSLYGLPLNDEGLIDNPTILTAGSGKNRGDAALQKLLKVVYVAQISSKVQGFAALSNGYVGTFNASYGNVSSHVTFMAWYMEKASDSDEKEFKFKLLTDAKTGKKQTFKMPPYLEQVATHNDSSLYYLFESGSSKYRNKTPYIIDRILSVSYDPKETYERAKSALKKEDIDLPAYSQTVSEKDK